MIRENESPQADDAGDNGVSGQGESGKSVSGKGSSGEQSPGKPGDEAARATSFWRRPRTRTVILCAGFLVIGVGLGSIVTSAAIHRMVRHSLRDPGRLASKVLSHMRGRLDLTDEQAEAVLPILKKRFTSVCEAIRREHDAIGKEIAPLLTPEQRAIQERIMEKRRERFLGSDCRKESPE
jgi:hypothetical protein